MAANISGFVVATIRRRITRRFGCKCLNVIRFGHRSSNLILDTASYQKSRTMQYGTVSRSRRRPAKDEDLSQDWVAAGLAELATGGGVDNVRVEVLAERMGVTKGGFYRRFKDRQALLDAMLETWREGRISAIQRHAEEGGKTPVDRIRFLSRIYTERANEQGMAIELAIRQWARGDRAAAGAVAAVDATRLSVAGSLFQSAGMSAQDADARAVLFYAFLFGQSLMFMNESPRKRASLIAACLKALTDI